MPREALLQSLEPLLQILGDLNAGDPAFSADVLNQGSWAALERAALEALEEGWLVTREAGPHVRFGRLAKAGPETRGFSIDAVVMDGPAPGAHTHLSGEFDFCLPLEGTPRFDGHGERWVVYPPGSRHIPTVAGGRMFILYFVPGGALRFD
jgi:Domain of unknown function (DUF4863)